MRCKGALAMLTVSASSSHIGEGVQKRSTTVTTSTAPDAVATTVCSRVRPGGRLRVPVLSAGGGGTSGDRTGAFTGCIDAW